MYHKALCRQQRSGCLLFLRSKKDATEKALQSACQHIKFHFSALKKNQEKPQQKQTHTTKKKKEIMLPCIRPEQENSLMMASDSSNNFNRKVAASYFLSYSVKSLCILYHDPTNEFPSKTPPFSPCQKFTNLKFQPHPGLTIHCSVTKSYFATRLQCICGKNHL